MHGPGTLIRKNGDKFQGKWLADKIDGFGKF